MKRYVAMQNVITSYRLKLIMIIKIWNRQMALPDYLFDQKKDMAIRPKISHRQYIGKS